MQILVRAAALAFLPSLVLAQQTDVSQAWQSFTRSHGPEWQVEWNPATGTPSAVFGPGLRLGGPVGSLAAARQAAQELFQRHAGLLGKGDSEFVEAIGVKARQVYILVYDQRYGGLPVIGGRADARIHEAGVVALFGSRAVPIPAGFGLQPTLAAAAATERARQAILGAVAARPVPAPRLVIWADTGAAQPTGATLAWEVQIDERPAQLQVGKAYIDAASGALLEFKNEVFYCSCGVEHVFGSGRPDHRPRLARAAARRAELVAARPTPAAPLALTGRVMGWVNKGHLPTAPLTNVPLPNLQVTSSAGSAFTDSNGNFSIPYGGTAPVVVTATLAGRHSKRVRVSQGTALVATASVTPGTPATLQFGSAGMGQFDRSQTTTYWFVDDINVWIRSLLPGSGTQIDRMSAVDPIVNLARSCNAFYTNFTINFFAESSTCANTAYETVIQHEWGHGIDHAFGGISQTDGLSEGWGDLLCIYRSRQPEVGPGFRKTSSLGIRSGNNTRTYPAGGGVHQQGETWMGWGWDVRGYLMATHGAAAGEALAHKIVVASIAANASNQPAAVREVFILDDNDGNLNNGTPNYVDLERAALKRNLPYPKKVNPNAGSYTTFGLGCPGSGKASSSCQSSNGSATASRNLTQNSNIFALGVPAPAGQLTVTGFELFTRSSGGPLNLPTQIYLADASGRPIGAPVRTGSMALTATLGWHKTTFTTPLVVSAGQKFFLSYTSVANGMLFPIAGSGALGQHFWHAASATAWNGPFTTQAWAWRVNCATGTGALPVLSNTGVPELNRSFSVELSAARPSATALLLTGASDAVWGSLTLPLNLDPLGATKCVLLSSGEAMFGVRTSTLGTASYNFNVPNMASLFGLTFFNQYVIEDTKNAFGLVFSNAGKGKIGKQ